MISSAPSRPSAPRPSSPISSAQHYQALYGDTKRKEALAHLRTVSDFDYRTYLPRF